MNLAKQGYEAYNDHSDSKNVNKTGGHEYNSPNNAPSSQGRPSFDREEAIRSAEQHGSGGSDLFAQALSFLTDNKEKHNEPVDEEKVQRSYERAYGSGGPSNMSASSLGSAAAMQILKQFTGGGSGHSSGGHGSSGGFSQTKLISMAMAEASKLFDKSGGSASGNKQDAVNGAAMTVMKLMVQSKLSGGHTTGGSNSGGLGGLMSMASHFVKH